MEAVAVAVAADHDDASRNALFETTSSSASSASPSSHSSTGPEAEAAPTMEPRQGALPGFDLTAQADGSVSAATASNDASNTSDALQHLMQEETLGDTFGVDDWDVDHIDDMFDGFFDDPRLQAALTKSMDIREYSKQVERELREIEEAAVDDYIAESHNFAELHEQISSCDSILSTMEQLLGGFQQSLGTISQSIQDLQTESSTMSLRLANRQAVSARVSLFVRGAVIEEALVRNICNGNVDEAYLVTLRELNDKLSYVHQAEGQATKATEEVKPKLEAMRDRAVVKVHEFLLKRIHSLRKPKTNVQIIQQNVLIKYKYAIRFLAEHAPNVANDVRTAYIGTMGKMYTQHLKSYTTALGRLRQVIASRHDLLGTEEGKLKTWTSRFAKSRATNVFALGSRDTVLAEVEAPAIVPHEAAEKKQMFSYDVLFRSLSHYLMDCACAEFLFDLDFWGKHMIFDKIFASPLMVVRSNVFDFVSTTYDAVGLLIMIRINVMNRAIMQRRGIAVLDDFFADVEDLLWPRLVQVMQLNVQSVREHAPLPLEVHVPVRPYYVIRRYAEFATSMLALTTTFKDHRVLSQLADLREAVCDLLTRLATAHEANEKDRVVFLISNYDQMLLLMKEKDIISTETVMFEDLLMQQVDSFVDSELERYFGNMMSWVRRNEPLLEVSGPIQLAKSEVESLARHFHDTWAKSAERLCDDIMFKYFSNFNLGSDILRQVLVKLTLCNKKFWAIVERGFGSNAFHKFYIAEFLLSDAFKKRLI